VALSLLFVHENENTVAIGITTESPVKHVPEKRSHIASVSFGADAGVESVVHRRICDNEGGADSISNAAWRLCGA